MTRSTNNRTITIDGVGSLILHGTDTVKHATVLNTLAAATRAEVVGLLMGAAYGSEAVERYLAEVGEDTPRKEAEERAKAVVSRPWPPETRIELVVQEPGTPHPIQVLTFDLQEPNDTLAGALVVIDHARAQAPARNN